MLHMSTYFKVYCFVILCELVLKTSSQLHLMGKPIFYKYNAKTHKLRCNCNPNKQCDKYGICSPDVCVEPYLGVNCQHVNVYFLGPRSNVPGRLADFNEKSCLSHSPSGAVYYTLNKPINFIWVYIAWKTTYNMKPRLTLYKTNALQTINKYLLKLNEKSVLIKLRQNVMYDKLELHDLPSDVCSLEVSIGRNLAISSSPSQSSVLPSVKSTALENARRAIDGSDYQVFYESKLTYCTHTQFPTSLTYEWWQTQLKHDALVNAVIILNRDSEQCRLQWSFVELFNSGLNVLYQHKITYESGRYEIPVSTDKWVRIVKLTVTTNVGGCNGYGIVTICEVYIYGELRCPAGKYGPTCDIDCPHGCPSREKCDPDWGCTEGCNGKLQGIWCDKDCTWKWGLPDCNKNCSETCSSQSRVGRGDCNITTGHCLYGCVAGYNRSGTPVCTTKCKFPYFGLDCAHTCDNCAFSKKHNVRRCHHVTGKCLDGCKQGFEGPDCEPMGKYLRYVLIGFAILFLLFVACWIEQVRHNNKRRFVR